MKRWYPILILFFASSVPLLAQSERSTDFGAIASAELSVDLKNGFGLSVEEELRFQDNCAQFDRWLNSIGVEYGFLHNRMKAGLAFDYIRRYNNDGYFENRGRIVGYLTYAETVRNFKFSLRTKLVSTFFDEQTGEHRINPKMYWRNRLQVSYQRPYSRFKYALSAEMFWLVNDPKNCIVDNIRTVASVDYRLTRRQYVSAFVRMENEIQVKQPVDRFYLGLTYKVKL